MRLRRVKTWESFQDRESASISMSELREKLYIASMYRDNLAEAMLNEPLPKIQERISEIEMVCRDLAKGNRAFERILVSVPLGSAAQAAINASSDDTRWVHFATAIRAGQACTEALLRFKTENRVGVLRHTWNEPDLDLYWKTSLLGAMAMARTMRAFMALHERVSFTHPYVDGAYAVDLLVARGGGHFLALQVKSGFEDRSILFLDEAKMGEKGEYRYRAFFRKVQRFNRGFGVDADAAMVYVFTGDYESGELQSHILTKKLGEIIAKWDHEIDRRGA